MHYRDVLPILNAGRHELRATALNRRSAPFKTAMMCAIWLIIFLQLCIYIHCYQWVAENQLRRGCGWMSYTAYIICEGATMNVKNYLLAGMNCKLCRAENVRRVFILRINKHWLPQTTIDRRSNLECVTGFKADDFDNVEQLYMFAPI